MSEIEKAMGNVSKQINIGRVDFDLWFRFENLKFSLMKRYGRPFGSQAAFAWMLDLAEQGLSGDADDAEEDEFEDDLPEYNGEPLDEEGGIL